MITKICNEIYNCFLSPVRYNERELFDKLYELSRYFSQNPLTLEAVQNLFESEERIMNSKGPNRQYVEKFILEILSRIVLNCSPEQTDTYLSLNEDLVKKATDSKEKQKYLVALKLVNFAIQIFHFKRARDSFGSKRKALALEIIHGISNYYDVPEALDLCLLSLKSKRETVVSATLDLLTNYHLYQEIPLSSDLIQILDDLIEHTNSRSIVFGAFDIQVKTGKIDELEAVFRMDEWKEKHYIW